MKRRMTPRSTGWLAMLTVSGCTTLVGLDNEYQLAPPEHAGGAGGAGGSGVCDPETGRECYSGPPGTETKGECSAGIQLCNADGMGYGKCVGEHAPQAEDCASPKDENCDEDPACTGAHRWSEAFGDSGDQFGEILVTDHTGNVVAGGSFGDSVDFGGGPLTSPETIDIFVAKLDRDGEHLWSKRFGDEKEQYITDLAITAEDDIVMTGSFEGAIDFTGEVLESALGTDIFVAKLGAGGEPVWSKRFGDSNPQYGRSVAVDDLGYIILTGYFDGDVNFGGATLTSAGDSDVFVAKLDPDGKHVWSHRFGAAGGQYGARVAADPDRNLILAGLFIGTLDIGGAPLPSAGDVDIFVAKLDESGAPTWSLAFGSSGIDDCTDIAIDPAGNIVMIGTFTSPISFGGPTLPWEGGTDIFVAKLSPKGEHLWSARFGDAGNQHVRGVALDPLGNILLIGDFQGELNFGGPSLTSSTGTDIFVAKLDPEGAHWWSKRMGDANNQEGHGVATDSAGNVLTTGYFSGILDLGGASLASNGLSPDIFIATFSP